jgi:hypothetical protein
MGTSIYAPVVLLHPPSCQRGRLRLVPPLKRRKRPALCACVSVALVAAVGLAVGRSGPSPVAETFTPATVPYVAQAFAPPTPIELKPYVASIPAGLPACSSGCPSYLVPR